MYLLNATCEFGFDTAKNEPLKVCRRFNSFFNSLLSQAPDALERLLVLDALRCEERRAPRARLQADGEHRYRRAGKKPERRCNLDRIHRITPLLIRKKRT